jgi:WD40 repeat protein
MTLHRDGLYVGGRDGFLRLLDVSSPNEISILGSQAVGVPITTITFDPKFETLAVGSPQGQFREQRTLT